MLIRNLSLLPKPPHSANVDLVHRGDVDMDDVYTHQQLSCMNSGELKQLCKKKSLSAKRKMAKMIERYLEAQANGFPTKKEKKPTQEDIQKKRADDAKRKAKSRANRSSDKKKEDNDKDAKYRAKVNAGKMALIEYQRPNRYTKMWEVPDKDYKLNIGSDDHTKDVDVALRLYHLNCGQWIYEETYWVIAYMHLRDRLWKNLKKAEELDSSRLDSIRKMQVSGTIVFDDEVSRDYFAMDLLEELYKWSVLERVTFIQFVNENVDDDARESMPASAFHNEDCLNGEEAYLEWLIYSEDGHELVLPLLKDCARDAANAYRAAGYNTIPESYTPRDVNVSTGSIGPGIYSIFGRIDTDRPFWIPICEYVQKLFGKYGFDISWMSSLIGLKLSIPEYWWKNEKGESYSKKNTLWKGKIVDVRISNFPRNDGLFIRDDNQYFVFKCDKEDEN